MNPKREPIAGPDLLKLGGALNSGDEPTMEGDYGLAAFHRVS